MNRPPRSLVATATAFWLLVALLDCGGGGGDDASPREKCDALFDVFCESVGECFNERNDLEGSRLLHDLCVERFQASGSCEGAVAVTPSYDPCVDGLHALSCDALFDQDNQISDDFSLPSNCRNVIQVRR